MRHRTPILLLLALVAARCPVPAASVSEPGFAIDRPIQGLGVLTSLRFAPDGTLFLTEKTGKVLVVPAGESVPRTFATVPVYTSSECGLLNLELGPDYSGLSGGGHVYLLATISSSEQRILRLRDSGGVGAERAELVTGLPTLGANHDGGGLRIAPDGKIYCSFGDGGSGASKAQDLKNLFGKVLRLELDGTIPPDNPDLSAIDPAWRREIFAWGFRNPFRLTLRPLAGGGFQVFANDVGSSGAGRREEVDIVLPGKNYGWPVVEGIAGRAEYVDPIHVYIQEGSSIVGGTFYLGGGFPPAYRGDYFFMDYVSNRVFRMVLDGDRVEAATTFATAAGGLIDIAEGPDGALWLSSAAGSVHRIRWTRERLAASISADPVLGPAPLRVAFGAAVAGGDPASYSFSWAFGDGGASADRDPVHVYGEPGTYTVLLVVEDGADRAEATAEIVVEASDPPPAPEILEPSEGILHAAGATVAFTGRAVDPVEGEVPGEDLSWTVTLVHDDHVHPWLDGVAGPSGSFAVPGAGIEEGWSFRIDLTARDSAGNAATASRAVSLDYLPVRLETDPPGLRLTADGVSLAGPAVYHAVRGARVEVGAPSPQEWGEGRYVFASFSDGGPMVHEVTAAPDLLVVARFEPDPALSGRLFLRGDATADGTLDIADPIAVLSALFAGGAFPDCADGADANDDGGVDISDPVAALLSLFGAAGPLPPPAGSAGFDPTPDGLGCRGTGVGGF